MNNVSIVIGSWGSYNECNERALGSKWLDLSEYDSYDDIKAELISEGFILDGIDEELFIQDIEGINDPTINWDYVNPEDLYNTLKEAEILSYKYKYNEMSAYLEINSWDDFKALVNNLGSDWDRDIYMYEGYDWEDYGREMANNMCLEIPENLQDFFDYEAYGEYIGSDYASEYSNGIIEIVP